ncbi:hypothetical protein I4641_02705 [Waterburya agarophytonicola K14]|uniref:Uncharacterized protein n=1 Tax=Waterburya agarophytonicola KI4 TaxID=2874699 RepID=A0A964BPD3_9CYAN|nr:hypothetical protein [Waterburya agarophytonicola]MCC0175892.1 hypothetical protein [Waterburya agarophytonicola KI4]
MGRRSRYKASKTTKDELRLSVFEPLNAQETELRLSLEQDVKTAFYRSGLALIELNQLRLYRSTHLSFEEFCQDVFGYSSDYAYLKMAAARVYQNLIDSLPTNGRHSILPTRQRQLRPIVKAKLDADAQVEVWQMAIALADGKIPSGSVVTEAVNLYLDQDNTQLNPFTEGEICRIMVKNNSKLKGKGGSWCIVEKVNDGNCIVNTWNDQLEVPLGNLESTEFDTEQYQNIEDIGVRMTELHQTGKLDKAALWVLNGLAKLDKPYLTTLEENLLQLLENFYLK